ncbi:MAG: WD40 repeat domain-containing protein [Chthoniobacterales bacterium]
MKIWDVATRQELCTLTEPAEVSAVTFSPDDQAIASGSKDGIVRLWSGGPAKASGAAVPRRP